MPDIITKALATISETDGETSCANGSFEAILSAPTLDRDGDTLGQDGWKSPLPDKIHIDLDHEMSVAGTVGSAVPFFDTDGNLRIKGTYASTPRAQEVRTLVNEGHITTMSVAFMTDRNVKDGNPSRELLNGAFVAVPSNREAKVLDSKVFDAIDKQSKGAEDKPYGDVTYADPGYQADGQHRYPLDSEAHVRAAWSYVNMPKNSAQYTAEQLAEIKDKIRAAAPKFGIKIDDSKTFHATIAAIDWFLNGEIASLTTAPAGTASASAGFRSSEPILSALEHREFSEFVTKAGARNSAGDSKMIQAIHDASAILGATCAETEPDADDGADEGANKSAPNVTVTISPDDSVDLEIFKAQLDAITGVAERTITVQHPTTTSGLKSGTPDSPADSPAEPPADAAPPGSADAAGDAAAEAAEQRAQKVARDLLADIFLSEVTHTTQEP